MADGGKAGVLLLSNFECMIWMDGESVDVCIDGPAVLSLSVHPQFVQPD